MGGAPVGSIGLVFQDHKTGPCLGYCLTEHRAVVFMAGKLILQWGPQSSDHCPTFLNSIPNSWWERVGNSFYLTFSYLPMKNGFK